MRLLRQLRLHYATSIVVLLQLLRLPAGTLRQLPTNGTQCERRSDTHSSPSSGMHMDVYAVVGACFAGSTEHCSAAM